MPLLGRLLAWSAHACEASITVLLASPGRRMYGPDYNRLPVTHAGFADTGMSDDTKSMKMTTEPTMSGNPFGACCDEDDVMMIKRRIIPMQGGLTDQDVAVLLQCMLSAAQPLQGGSGATGGVPIHAVWLRQHMPGESGMVGGASAASWGRTGVCFDADTGEVCFDPEYAEMSGVPTVASQMLGSIDGVCDDHDRALQLAVSQYLDGCHTYMCSDGGTAARAKFAACLPRGSGGGSACIRCVNPTTGEVCSWPLDATPASALSCMSRLAVANPTDRNGVRLICHAAAGPRFAPPRNYSAENAIRKCWCRILEACNRGGGTAAPPATWSAADRDACSQLFMNIPSNACGGSMDTSCSGSMDTQM